MIENIRKYTGLIFIVIVLLLLGFIFMDTSSFFRGQVGGGATYVRIGNRAYSHNEFLNLGSAPLQLASQLRSFDANGFKIMEFAESLAGAPAIPQLAPEEKFFVSRMLLRQARDEFGIHPSDEAVADFIRSLSAFQSNPGLAADPSAPRKFDQAAYNEFIQKRIGRFGLSERDFHELIRDVIASSTLRDVIGAGLTGSRDLAQAMVANNAQKLDLATATIDKKAIRDSIQPTDEELQTYWDTLKDAFQTERRLKVSYLLLSPEKPEPAENPAPAEGEEAAAEDTPPDAEATAKAARDLAAAVDSFSYEVMESEGARFDALAEEYGWKPVATDWFTASTIPTELQLQPRGTSAGRTISSEIMKLATGPDPLARFSDPLAVGTDQWLLVRLDEAEEPRTKTFEEAKDEVRERYVAEKTDEAARAQTEEKTKAIEESLKEGRSFFEAAKAAGLEARDLRPYGVSESLDNEFHAREIFAQAATTNPGNLAPAFHQDDRALLIYVEDRTIVADDARAQQVDSFMSNLSSNLETAAFMAWLNSRLESANVSGPAVQ